tara:strand:+ start:86 stop:889 length:804 start_codon:yes stop_codon:yes gene_type:complete
MDKVSEFNENGYIIVKNLLSELDCEELTDWLSKYNNFSKKDLEPYSNIPYIYNNITDGDSLFTEKIINNEYIKSFSKTILKEESEFYFLKVNNKSKWIGQDICYHQEYAISKYMGLKEDDSIQIFLALEPHKIENGCLKIIEKSHKEGEIEHENFFDSSFNHKLRVSYESMENLNKKYNLKNCILNPGDCIIFNQFLVHGSASNKSQYNRKAVVGWITKKSFVFNKEKNKEFWIKRQKITLEHLKSKISETTEKINEATLGMTLLKK